jgi:AcrR family transcriptional regulator
MKSDAETRVRLLEAALRLFGENGFKRVTVRDICRAAAANVAAVNYHFGDKLGLYREVLQSAIEAMRATSEAARAAGEGRRPEEQLRTYVRIFLQNLLRPESAPIHRLVTREMNDPTAALDAVVEQGIRPRIEYLSDVIARVMSCDPGDPRVLRCVGSVQAQAVAYLPNAISVRLGYAFKPTPANIEKAANHIAAFSLAGIRAVARREQHAEGGRAASSRR